MSKVFSTMGITTKGHWAVGTEWTYAKGTVTMHDDGFSCTCRKNPRVPCNHIKNVKLRMYGTFDEHYLREEV
jgi:hypothetical protein